MSLASTHPNLLFLMPKEQNVVGEDFTEDGPYDGHFCPETYMDVPILTRGLISVKMSFRWRDQGFSCFVFCFIGNCSINLPLPLLLLDQTVLMKHSQTKLEKIN